MIQRIFIGILLFLAGCARQEAPASALRLVSTAPHLTEALCAIGAGDLLVGRTDACDYPTERLQKIPAVGGFGTPSLESLLEQRPTHLVETILAKPDIKSTLEPVGISVVHVPIRLLADIPPALRQLGELTGHTREATRLAETIQRGIREAQGKQSLSKTAPRVFLLLTPDTPMTLGKSTFVSELLELAGGVNVGRESLADYYHVSLEWLLEKDPDLILCLYETYGQDPCHLLKEQIGWKALSAVRHQRVYTLPDLNSACRPGPRVLEGLGQFKTVLARDAQEAQRAGIKADERNLKD